ncbi:FabD/lysophospholipase-like protein [Saccharata proteae CBS 121410]|uniref:FabD/lysophospholipase-like protein n=1 Tax=Saccharata proteae CBS 121410 TaxID=1314787 RepID=A0A9P4HL75_9PEZI|nr:FabD/lysophospholipase-like protein [Saccharata proteae CBS 121410]
MQSPSPEGVSRNPNAPLRLLSLDGGGVRGLSSLMVLEDLMENIMLEEKRLKKRASNDNTPLKPCDYFDIIGGTSTGGIIAVLLGRLRLDVRSCIKIYSRLAQDIFKNDRSINFFGLKVPIGATRFSGYALEQAIKSALTELGYSEDEPMWDGTLFEESESDPEFRRDSIWTDLPPTQAMTDSPEQSMTLYESFEDARTTMGRSQGESSYGTMPESRSSSNPYHSLNRKPTWRMHKRSSVHRKAHRKGCRTFVISTLKNALGLPRILSTYDPNDRHTKIWEALRATSAAPTFFEEMTFGVPRLTYLDGGIGYNNPCAEVDYAARSIWEGRQVGIIVSVGTGLQTIPSVKLIASWLPFGLGNDIAIAAALASMATGTARVDNEMQRMYHGSDTRYYRFDVDGGLANVSLEQWMKEDEMASLTEQYMQDGNQLQKARDLGELMVKLTALPPAFNVSAHHFHVGVNGRGILDGEFRSEELDFKTGAALGVKVTIEDKLRIQELQSISPMGEGGVSLDNQGHTHKVFPIALDLDGDGKRDEAIVHTCVRSENICLRALRRGIPPGRYRVKFIVCFFGTEHAPPTELVFSVGKPFDTKTFAHRYVDVKITPDVVPVLLHPDAVRVRVGRKRHGDRIGKGWIEIEGDVEASVGLDGDLGFIVSKKFEERVAVGGWSFGGVRLEPVFGT